MPHPILLLELIEVTVNPVLVNALKSIYQEQRETKEWLNDLSVKAEKQAKPKQAC